MITNSVTPYISSFPQITSHVNSLPQSKLLEIVSLIFAIGGLVATVIGCSGILPYTIGFATILSGSLSFGVGCVLFLTNIVKYNLTSMNPSSLPPSDDPPLAFNSNPIQETLPEEQPTVSNSQLIEENPSQEPPTQNPSSEALLIDHSQEQSNEISAAILRRIFQRQDGYIEDDILDTLTPEQIDQIFNLIPERGSTSSHQAPRSNELPDEQSRTSGFQPSEERRPPQNQQVENPDTYLPINTNDLQDQINASLASPQELRPPPFPQNHPASTLLQRNSQILPQNPVLPTLQSPSLNLDLQTYEFYYFLGKKIKITIFPQDLLENPLSHLEKLIPFIKTSPYSNLKVVFLTPDGLPQPGIDASGLRRQYISDLMSGLMKKIPTVLNEGLHFPKIGVGLHGYNSIDVKNCERLGCLLMYCHINALPTGIYLDPSLFQLMNFSFKQLSDDFENLSFEDKFFVAKSFNFVQSEVAESNDQSKELRNSTNVLLESIEKGKTKWNKQDIKNLVYLCSTFEIDLSDVPETEQKIEFQKKFGPYFENDYLDLPDDKINELLEENDHKQIIDSLMSLTFDACFNPTLLPMFHIAKGMNSICSNWHSFTSEMGFYSDCSEKLQGSFNKQQLCERMKCKLTPDPNNPYYLELEKKIGWIKDWILNKANEKQIKDFIRFASGGSSLPHNKKIKISAQAKRVIGRDTQFDLTTGKWIIYDRKGYSPAPEAHTCFFEICLAPEPCGGTDLNSDYHDSTPEGFYRCLEAVIEGNSFTDS